MAMGFCDKRQYEHAGPHNRITEHGQMLPPFPCVNWRPTESDDEREERRSAQVEAYWQAKQGEEYGSY